MYWVYDMSREASAWRAPLLEHLYIYNISWGGVEEFLMLTVIAQYSDQKRDADLKALSFSKGLSQ